MSAQKFASITADLLARKGDASPSGIARPSKATLAWDTQRIVPEMVRFSPMHATLAQSVARPPAEVKVPTHEDERGSDDAPPAGFADHVPATADKRHRISLALTTDEHERLGIVAVKRGMTRHQLMRHALDDYFQKLASEYRTQCACVSGRAGCRTGCDCP
jgi:hypothetical protein